MTLPHICRIPKNWVQWFSCARVQMYRVQLHGGSVARGFSCMGVQLHKDSVAQGLCCTGVQLQWNQNTKFYHLQHYLSVDVILLNPAKAFDKVQQKLLIFESKAYEVHKNVVHRRFLTGRTHRL